ncbi:Wzz/FepE/Etk N-terminal domain-containing protein [Hydrogenophaga soli]|nr:Wzz/FepE/Etk N-terminal domain-containing protein [Burkholderiaceae bacterium]
MQNTLHDPGISLTQIGAMLAARKTLMGVVSMVTVVAAIGISLALPKTYTAKAEIYIEYRGADPILGRQFSAMQDESYMATQVDIIRSDDVVRHIIDSTRAMEQPAMRELANGKDEAVVRNTLLKAISADLEVVPRRNSRVLELQFSAKDPAFARDALNAAIKGYMDITSKIHTAPAKTRQEQYSAQLLALQTEVDRIQGEITAYQQREGILDADERLDTGARQFADLNGRLLGIQASMAEAGTRKRAVQSLVAGGTKVSDVPEISRLEGVRDIRLRLIDVDSRLSEASGVLGPNHPKYKALLADRDALVSQLERAASSALQSIEQEERRFADQAGQLQRDIAARQQQMLEMKKHRDVIASYQRQLASAQQVYNAAVARYDEILIQSNVNTPTIAVLQWAERPVRHSKPNIVNNIIVSVPGGLILGLLCALLLELSYRRVRCAEDLQGGLPVPVLGAS